MVPADSDKISRVSPYSGYHSESKIFRLQGYHLLWLTFPGNSTISRISYSYMSGPTTPDLSLVWAVTFSLATTKVIDFSFSSSGYLDVSVHRVTLVNLCIQLTILAHYHKWVPPFGYLRIKAYLLLPEAFRCLSRPSSASSAKAFNGNINPIPFR